MQCSSELTAGAVNTEVAEGHYCLLALVLLTDDCIQYNTIHKFQIQILTRL